MTNTMILTTITLNIVDKIDVSRLHSRFFTLTLTEETTDQKKIFFLLCRVKKRDVTGQLNFFILEIQ